jgi:hypothetical protein
VILAAIVMLALLVMTFHVLYQSDVLSLRLFPTREEGEKK